MGFGMGFSMVQIMEFEQNASTRCQVCEQDASTGCPTDKIDLNEALCRCPKCGNIIPEDDLPSLKRALKFIVRENRIKTRNSRAKVEVIYMSDDPPTPYKCYANQNLSHIYG